MEGRGGGRERGRERERETAAPLSAINNPEGSVAAANSG